MKKQVIYPCINYYCFTRTVLNCIVFYLWRYLRVLIFWKYRSMEIKYLNAWWFRITHKQELVCVKLMGIKSKIGLRLITWWLSFTRFGRLKTRPLTTQLDQNMMRFFDTWKEKCNDQFFWSRTRKPFIHARWWIPYCILTDAPSNQRSCLQTLSKRFVVSIYVMQFSNTSRYFLRFFCSILFGKMSSFFAKS